MVLHLSRPRLRNDFSTCAVFVNLVSQRAERNPEQLCRGSAAPTLVFQRSDNEFALDLRDRMPDETSNGLQSDLRKGQAASTVRSLQVKVRTSLPPETIHPPPDTLG